MTVQEPLSLDALDITNEDLYHGPRGYPWAEFDRFREEAPVFWYEAEGFKPFWSVTRHDDTIEISQQSDVFISTRRLRIYPEDMSGPMIDQRIKDEEAMGVVEAAPISFIDMDEPHHSKYRSLINKHFTPKANDARMPLLNEVGDECVNRFLREVESEKYGVGVADFVDTVGMYMPTKVILEMLGVPDEMQLPLYYEVDHMIRPTDPDEIEEARKRREEQKGFAFGKAFEMMTEVMEMHKPTSASGDSLMDIILRSEVDGAPITPKQHMGFVQLIIFAGLETTRNAIAGGIQALLAHPDQMQKLIDNPTTEMVNSTTEEILRWVSPVIHFSRTCVKEYELRGQTIKPGEDVCMWYPAANRDPEVFEDPYTFDITRTPNDHLAFGGYGTHFCLGANLARWEIRKAFEKMLPLLPRLELVEDPRWLGGLHVGGFEKVLVRLND